VATHRQYKSNQGHADDDELSCHGDLLRLGFTGNHSGLFDPYDASDHLKVYSEGEERFGARSARGNRSVETRRSPRQVISDGVQLPLRSPPRWRLSGRGLRGEAGFALADCAG